MKYVWIEAQGDSYPVSLMCDVLGVSRSGYYARRTGEPSQQAQRRQRIAKAAEQSHHESGGVYGYRKVHEDLKEQQVACCRETVRRVLAEKGLFSRTRRKFVVTTDSAHEQPVAENRLERNFTATAANQKWAADITYLWTAQGWLYLAVVMDLFSRRIVGWSLRASLKAALVLEALEMGLAHRQPDPGLLHHSDRGSQYASDDFRRLLESHGIVCSMSRKGNCWDNAPVESFFGKLKTEWVHGKRYATREEARLDVFKYIELFYNRKRRHAALGYLSPVAYEEQRLQSTTEQAA